MKNNLVLLLIRVFPISLVFPAGLVITVLVLGFLVGTFGFFVGGCNSFHICYWSPFLEFIYAPKSWEILLLLWGVGLFFVYRQVYRDF